jgi:hypothetical protein
MGVDGSTVPTTPNVRPSPIPRRAPAVALVRRRGGRWCATITPKTLAWLPHAARIIEVRTDAS